MPVTFLNAVLLFGIEELGVQIEEPFSILALDEICEDIHSIAKESQMVTVPPQNESNSTLTTTTDKLISSVITGSATIPALNSSILDDMNLNITHNILTTPLNLNISTNTTTTTVISEESIPGTNTTSKTQNSILIKSNDVYKIADDTLN